MSWAEEGEPITADQILVEEVSMPLIIVSQAKPPGQLLPLTASHTGHVTPSGQYEYIISDQTRALKEPEP